MVLQGKLIFNSCKLINGKGSLDNGYLHNLDNGFSKKYKKK
jgi:hypothetical protein